MEQFKRLAQYKKLGIDIDASVFSAEALSRSSLLKYVSQVIAHATHCDLALICIATRFLKSDFEATFEMLKPLGDNARADSINGAALSSIADPQDRELYLSTLKAVRWATKPRQKFAHWCFGEHKDLPNALLLLDAKLIAKQFFFSKVRIRRHSSTANYLQLTPETEAQIEVYEEQHLELAVKHAADAEELMWGLFAWLGPPSKARDEAQTWLCRSPLVQRYLSYPT